MTIRDDLTRRVRLLFGALLIAWAAIPVSMSVFGPDPHTKAGLPWPVFVCFFAFAGVMLLLAKTNCPLCKESLYGIVGDIGFRPDQDFDRYCPNCRADFNEPVKDTR